MRAKKRRTFRRAIIEINPAETPLTSAATISIRGTAGEAGPHLLAD